MMDKFPEIQKSKSLQGAIVSMGLVGAILGLELGRSVNVNDRFGRRPSTLAANLCIFCGGLLTIKAPNPWLIIVGRLLVGIGVAMASTTASLYVSEVLPTKIKSIMIMYGIAFIYGQFSAYICYWVSPEHAGSVWLVLGQGIAFALGMLLNLTLLPESPRKGKESEAIRILVDIYDGEELDEHVEALEFSEEPSDDTGDILAALKGVHKALGSKIGLDDFKQVVGGVEVLMYYTLPVLQFAGISRGVVLGLSFLIFGLTALSIFD